ncbi:ATP phosphoribosyltransferase regulatory subunit [bacterium]|nr:ATP phosphoribosyltransferase regulatory subunit [bacterium]
MSIKNAQVSGDILAAEVSPWHFMENVAIELSAIYGYQEVRTPIFEKSELFAQGMGSSAGIVENELWNITDKQGRRLALRADMLLPVMRACIERGIGSKTTDPEKFYYLGPVFSSSRGRDNSARQHNRFGVCSIGSSLPSLDVEAMMLAHDFFTSLGLNDLKVQLNSLGCKKCRAEYQQTLYEYFSRRAEELCPTCRRRHRSHPIWTMGCREKQCRELAQVAPSIFGCLCAECREHFEGVKAYLKELKIPYTLSPLLVPDIEYYNRTYFSISCGGHRLSIGGRCDELSALINGGSIPGVGCDIDLDETLAAIKEANLVPEIKREIEVCLAGSSQMSVALLLPVLYALRRAGIYAELAYPETVDGTALYTASRSEARFVIYLDDSSLHQRIVRFKDYSSPFRDMHLNDAINLIGRYFGIERLEGELRPVEVRKFQLPRRQSSNSHQGYDIYEPSSRRDSAVTEEAKLGKYSDGGADNFEPAEEELKRQQQVDYEMMPVNGGKNGSRHSVRSRRSRIKESNGEGAAEETEAGDKAFYDEGKEGDIPEGVSSVGKDRKSAKTKGAEDVKKTHFSLSEPVEALKSASNKEVDAIAEISASEQAMSEEEIEKSLALPKIEIADFAAVADPEVSSLYNRRYVKGKHSRLSDSGLDDDSRRNYDRGFSEEDNGYYKEKRADRKNRFSKTDSDAKAAEGKRKNGGELRTPAKDVYDGENSETAFDSGKREAPMTNIYQREYESFFSKDNRYADYDYGMGSDDKYLEYMDYDKAEGRNSPYAEYMTMAYDGPDYSQVGSYSDIGGLSDSNNAEMYSYYDSMVSDGYYPAQKPLIQGKGRSSKYSKKSDSSSSRGRNTSRTGRSSGNRRNSGGRRRFR